VATAGEAPGEAAGGGARSRSRRNARKYCLVSERCDHVALDAGLSSSTCA
jgi:hypothetical protein